MERKIIKNHTAPHPKYLINLIHLFISIQDELKKIPHFDCNYFIELKGINEDCIKKSLPQRHIKKQNEVKLFKETFQEICLINKKKPRARKSDIVMKFTMVSNILIQRMKESLCIKGESKEMLIQNLSKLKDSFMVWGQNSLNLSKPSHSSDPIHLKYVFSQLATTNASAHNSRTMSKYHEQGDKEGNELKRREDENEEHNFDENCEKLRPMQRYQRHTVNFNQESQVKKKNKVKRYSRNFLQTQEKKNLPQSTIFQHSISVKEKFDEVERKPRKKTNFYDKTFTLLNKNPEYSNPNNNEEKCTSNELIEEQKQMKKSAYYMSQNYIRSRKNIENITLFVNVNNKTKKQINNLFLNMDPSHESDVHSGKVLFQRTSGYKSTKFLTKKYIPDEEPQGKVLQIKSQKTIPRKASAFMSKGGNTHTGFYEKKPISKFHKNTSEEIEEIKLEKPPQFLKKQFTSIKQENGIEIIENKTNPQSNPEGKNLKQFYNELGEMRSQFQKPFDPYFQNKSVFFQQQSTIWDEQKRRLQRVLEQRSRQLYFRQFKMQFFTSHRQQQQALKAIRSDIFNYNPNPKFFSNLALDQIELTKGFE